MIGASYLRDVFRKGCLLKLVIRIKSFRTYPVNQGDKFTIYFAQNNKGNRCK